MKKLMYFAAALLVLAGCNKKDNALTNAPEGTPFKKGQQVTLTVGTGNNANQVAPRKVAGVDNTAESKIDFTWEEGDKILVKVGDKTAEFTLNMGAGSADGVFTGTMPAAGSTFDIQYPTTTPDLSAQVYTATKTIPADKMLFTATDCTLDAPATLIAQNAMVQLNLFGTDKTVGKIVFTNTTASPAVSYTLTCTDGKAIGATEGEATPFYMVVPTGEYMFEVEVYDNATTPAKICSFAPSAAKTFTAGQCLNMPAKEVADPYNGHAYVDLGLPSGLKWATCNVGATSPEGYGDYFAWGETEPYYTGLNADGSVIGWKEGKENGYAWLSNKWGNAYNAITKYCISSSHGTVDNKTTLEPEDDAAHVNWGGNWRMPTKAEQDELRDIANCTWTWTSNYKGTGVAGYIVTSTRNSNTIFLPASGYYYNSSLKYVGSNGDFWSSSLAEVSYSASDFNFNSEFLDYGEAFRYFGSSVRPVCK